MTANTEPILLKKSNRGKETLREVDTATQNLKFGKYSGVNRTG